MVFTHLISSTTVNLLVTDLATDLYPSLALAPLQIQACPPFERLITLMLIPS